MPFNFDNLKVKCLNDIIISSTFIIFSICRYSLASSMNFMNSAGITPPIRTPEKKFYRTADGFRIPVNRKLPAKSGASSMLS